MQKVKIFEDLTLEKITEISADIESYLDYVQEYSRLYLKAKSNFGWDENLVITIENGNVIVTEFSSDGDSYYPEKEILLTYAITELCLPESQAQFKKWQTEEAEKLKEMENERLRLEQEEKKRKAKEEQLRLAQEEKERKQQELDEYRLFLRLKKKYGNKKDGSP